jgi:acetoin utilization deacetylase AcuC-like enzyme
VYWQIYRARNFPARKRVAHTNIGLPDGTGDEEYLAVLGDELGKALEAFRPDLVLYDAGVDVHVRDKLGRLALTDIGIR